MTLEQVCAMNKEELLNEINSVDVEVNLLVDRINSLCDEIDKLRLSKSKLERKREGLKDYKNFLSIVLEEIDEAH